MIVAVVHCAVFCLLFNNFECFKVFPLLFNYFIIPQIMSIRFVRICYKWVCAESHNGCLFGRFGLYKQLQGVLFVT